MAMSRAYLDYVLDQLRETGPVEAKRMFGGAGLYLHGTIFGLIAGDVLYFKVGPHNLADYEARDCGRFAPIRKDGTPMAGAERMPYRVVPEDVLEDAEELAEWARKALGR